MVRKTPKNKRSLYISIRNLDGTNLIKKNQTIQIVCTIYNSNTCVYILYICMYKNYTHYMSHVDNYAQDITHTHTYVLNIYVCTYITYKTYTFYNNIICLQCHHPNTCMSNTYNTPHVPNFHPFNHSPTQNMLQIWK
jgi:hypothetical protein